MPKNKHAGTASHLRSANFSEMRLQFSEKFLEIRVLCSRHDGAATRGANGIVSVRDESLKT